MSERGETSKISEASESKANGRIQAGNIHFCTRGNNRKIIFLNDSDKVEFLRRAFLAANKYDSKIEAFAVMDNHLHLQIITEQITNFASWLLRGYAYWYNKKYSLSDKLFRTPFMSYCKYEDEWRINSILYILLNPLSAGMCTNTKDYKFNSYNFMYGSRAINPIKSFRSALDSNFEFIDIAEELDTSFIYSHFKSRKELDLALQKFRLHNSSFKIDKNQDNDSNKSKERVPTFMVLQKLSLIIGDKPLSSFSREEQFLLIKKLREETGASFPQLSSIFDESYEYIRRVFRYGRY